MKKMIATAAVVALSTSVVATSVAPTSASAATTYKIKSGKLVNAKTGKVVKGLKVYKSTLYKDGKKAKGYVTSNKVLYKDGKAFTGLRSAKYYKAGKLATGSYKNLYYKSGKAHTGLVGTTYYKAGKKYTGLVGTTYYKAGKKHTGLVGTTYYKAGKKHTGLVGTTYYKAGKKHTGLVKDTYYKAGKVYTGLVGDTYYVDGKAGDGEVEGVKYVAGSKAQGLIEGTFYVDGKAGNGEAEGVKYVAGSKAQGLIEGKYYVDGLEDLDKPVITAEDVTVKYGSVAPTVEQLVTSVEDNSKEELTATIKTIKLGETTVEAINTKIPGEYVVTLSAKDVAGNETEKEVKVTVTEGVAVKSIKAIDELVVVAGSDMESILPTTVEATLDNETADKENLAVAWTAPEGFDVKKAASYVFSGVVTSVDGVKLTDEQVKSEVKVTIVSEEDYAAAVKNVKTTAQDTDLEAFKAALAVKVLALNVKEANVEAYKAAIKDAFSAATVEEIQTIIDATDKKIADEAAKVEAAKVKAIVEAQTISAFTTALTEADIKHVETSTDVKEYKEAVVKAAPTSLVDVQAAVNAVNHSKVEAKVVAAEKAATAYKEAVATTPLAATVATLKATAEKAVTDATTILTNYKTAYGTEVFDEKVSTATDAKGKYETRIATVVTANEETATIVTKAEIASDIKAFTPTITPKQIAEADNAQSTVEVAVQYPTVVTTATETTPAATLYGNENKYKVTSAITVPAAFAGIKLAFVVDGHTIEYTVPAAEKDATTITFSLTDVTNAALTTLADNNGGNWTVKVVVPYETTTLKAGSYDFTVASIVSPDFAAEKAEVTTIATSTLAVNIIENQEIPKAIKAIYDAAKAENATTIETQLKAEVLETAGLTYKAANEAEYLAAFKAATYDAKTSVATVQEIINAVDTKVALADAITTLEASTDTANTITALQVASFGYDTDSTKNKLNVVKKNAQLYLDAIKAAKAKNTVEPVVPTFTKVSEIQALVNDVNETLLGKVNAAKTIADTKSAVEAVVAKNADLGLYYNVLTDIQKIKVAEKAYASTGYATNAELLEDIKSAQ